MGSGRRRSYIIIKISIKFLILPRETGRIRRILNLSMDKFLFKAFIRKSSIN